MTQAPPVVEPLAPRRAAAYAQPVLPLTWGGQDAAPPVPVDARVVHRRSPGALRPDERLPEPGAWIAALVRSVLEVVQGERPRRQLLRWVDAEVYEWLGRVGPPGGRGSRVAAVRSVHVCRPASRVVEASVLVSTGTRVRAIALRLEAVEDRWRATRLDLL